MSGDVQVLTLEELYKFVGKHNFVTYQMIDALGLMPAEADILVQALFYSGVKIVDAPAHAV